MGTHASVLVVDENRTTAAYGYEHGDGQDFMQNLLEFAVRRNEANLTEFGEDDASRWPVTPAEFVTRWAAQRRLEHQRYGRTGSGVTVDDAAPNQRLRTEYAHLVVVNGHQVVSARRVLNARYGAGSSYTVTFDHTPVTAGKHPTPGPPPELDPEAAH